MSKSKAYRSTDVKNVRLAARNTWCSRPSRRRLASDRPAD